MKFISFKIKKFKGIKEIQFTLNSQEKRIYTLIGLNESGKTTILEALNAFLGTVSASGRHKLIPKREKFHFNDTIEITGKMELNLNDRKEIGAFLKELGYPKVSMGDNVTVKRKYTFKNSEPIGSENLWTITINVAKGREKLKSLYDLDFPQWQACVRFIETNLFPTIIYYPNFLFDFPEKIYLDSYPQDSINSIEYEKYKDVVQDILYSMDSTLTIEEHILNRIKNKSSENEETLDLLINKMARQVSQTVFSAWERLFKKGNKEIVIRYGQEADSTGKIHHYLQFKLKEGEDLFLISERSLGFKWFFSFLLFTEFRRKRITDKGELLFLLDEPASNLHPTAQKNILQTFNDLLSRSSVIYTTHSHYLINPEWINGMYIVRNKSINYNEDGLNNSFNNTEETDIEMIPYKRFVATYPNQREYFQPLLDTLDFQPGLLEKIPSIIITEGKNDYFTFKYLLDNYFKGVYELNFYPGGGATSDEQIIRLYTAWNKDFVILRDADKEGKKSVENYKAKFKLLVENRAFSYKEISNNFDNCALEDIFDNDERLAITQISDNSADVFEKSRFNLSIQHLLAEKRTINLSEATLHNFKCIFDFLAQKVSIEKSQ